MQPRAQSPRDPAYRTRCDIFTQARVGDNRNRSLSAHPFHVTEHSQAQLPSPILPCRTLGKHTLHTHTLAPAKPDTHVQAQHPFFRALANERHRPFVRQLRNTRLIFPHLSLHRSRCSHRKTSRASCPSIKGGTNPMSRNRNI